MCKRLYQYSFLILLLCILSLTVKSQNLKDSVLKLASGKRDTALTRSTIGAADTTFNALINRVDYYADQFNKISNQLNEGFDTLNVSQELPFIEKRLKLIETYSSDHNLLTIRSFTTFQDYFATSQKQLTKWDAQLTTYNNFLVQMQETLCGLTTDSVFQNLPADSALRNRFFDRLNSLGEKWHHLDSISNRAILNIGFLQNRVSATQLDIIDFNEKIKEILKELGSRTFYKEYDYLWDLSLNNFYNDLKSGIVKTITINYKVLTYYLRYSYKVHIINFFLFLVLFLWIAENRKTILRENSSAADIFSHSYFTARYPAIAALAVTCTIGPFFYYHPTTALNQLYLILLMICIGILMYKNFSNQIVKYWFYLIGFVILYSFSNLYFNVINSERIIFFILTAAVLSFSVHTYKKFRHLLPENRMKMAKRLMYAYFFLLIVSLVANIFGRYSLSKIAGTTALFTLVEGISLVVFVKIITEGIYLQMEVGKIHVNRISSYLDFKNLKNRVGNFLKFLALILLLVFFTQNLNVFDNIYDETKDFLAEVRKIGNTTFTFGSFIIFILIIYLATAIGKIISYFFEFADEHAAKTTRRGKYSSSILLVRLSIWIIGFLIAIAASGIALDKITIIIGALGVGIGFGLQTLVNNVVSGLVMVFEKPIQVGDLIEVGDKTGIVRSMGIRASKIHTLDGSEVIVPNGDLLSKNLINWTLSNTHKRISLEIGVAYGSDIDQVKEIFENILKNDEQVMQNPSPLVLLESFGDNAVNFKILCWVADIDNWLVVKSILMSNIFTEFYKQGIQIPFPQRDLHVYMKDKEVDKNAVKSIKKVIKGNPLKEE